jgi:hypothetical protein
MTADTMLDTGVWEMHGKRKDMKKSVDSPGSGERRLEAAIWGGSYCRQKAFTEGVEILCITTGTLREKAIFDVNTI